MRTTYYCGSTCKPYPLAKTDFPHEVVFRIQVESCKTVVFILRLDDDDDVQLMRIEKSQEEIIQLQIKNPFVYLIRLKLIPQNSFERSTEDNDLS
jgi:hypothetical protein